MANVLKREKQEMVISALVEGNSIRSVERMTGVHRDTIMRLMVRVGEGCRWLMDTEMRDLPCERIQVDEIWGFVGKKQRHLTEDDDPREKGDMWTWVALDPDSKAVPSYLVGKRTWANARTFMSDLAERLSYRVQISADALEAYVGAIDQAFGPDADFGQIVKVYEAEPIGPGRYSPPKVTRAERWAVWGDPDPDHISTSHVERNNLTMRMSMRRLTRLTNAFSKKRENLEAAVALHFGHYNFVRRHGTIRTTPAVAVGVADDPWTVADLLDATT